MLRAFSVQVIPAAIRALKRVESKLSWQAARSVWQVHRDVLQCLPTVAAAATMGKHRPAPMRLANPTPIRLSQAQLDWLDAWRGNTMSRSSAIRLLLEQVMREQQAATK